MMLHIPARRRTQAVRRSAEDGRGSPTLFNLCARVVSANMDRLEQDVWDLPAVILQGVLPLLNIYHLERIEQAAVKKGLSTQHLWRKYWTEIMKGGRPDCVSVKCWRNKFMEALFHNVLRGVVDVSVDGRLDDKRCSPLFFSSRHVKEFTMTNRQPGVSKLSPGVLDCLSESVETLKLLHLRSSDDVGMRFLKIVLHRLIHHGQVNKLALLSWPAPDSKLLEIILSISAGFWQYGDPPCTICSNSPSRDYLKNAHDPRLGAHPLQTACTARVSRVHCIEEEVVSQSALLSLQPLNISQNVAIDVSNTKCADNSMDPTLPMPAVGSKVASTSKEDLKSGSDLQDDVDSKQDDLYDFIFSAPKGEGNAEDLNDLHKESSAGEVVNLGAVPVKRTIITFKNRNVTIPYLEGAHYLRSVRTLNLHNISLSQAACHSLCVLLQTWVSLERLTLAYNDIGANIAMVIGSLANLSNHPECSLQAISLSDFTAFIPTIHLSQMILSSFPRLQIMSLSYDMENPSSIEMFKESMTVSEFKENQLKQLDLRFPQDPLHSERLVSLLQASTSLLELSLDNSTFPNNDLIKTLLRTFSEHNTALKKLNLHDIKLIDAQKELVWFLENTKIEDLRLSFCRLFERTTVDFFTQFAGALKKNKCLKVLKLCGNRLGNEGLVVMAEIYAPDSLSRIHHLDVSSNCIRPDGLLQFAKKLEKYGNPKLRYLSIAQNLLDRDPVMAQEALKCMEDMFCVVSDRWDSTQALVDHLSIMRALFPNGD
ncbi:leucine-rich repeat-containing protein 41 isoform X2 [Pelobates fuscus]|uniref:leucine-rich repeat-containing protein 41 isoform X2 n=1 Tax=Pelobates fuscus TaxID=191477 RepID=UPI002FE4AB18